MDDSSIVNRILDCNDNSAFAELVNRYQKLVSSTCSAFVPIPADVDDLVQDVFVELFQSLKNFRHESKLSTWIYRIAVNKSLDYIRKKNRYCFFSKLSIGGNPAEDDSLGHTSVQNEADYSINSAEEKRILKQAVSKLPNNQRVALILCKLQGLSYKEIADIMGVSVASVESLLFRAKVNLRKNIANFL